MQNGFSKTLLVIGGCEEREVRVQANVDLDSRFLAWDVEGEEYIYINGWACDIEEL